MPDLRALSRHRDVLRRVRARDNAEASVALVEDLPTISFLLHVLSY